MRAERAIQWPEPQDIAELRLNFIRLERNIGRFRLAVISGAPFLAGIVAIWLIITRVFDVAAFAVLVEVGGLASVPDALRLLATTPDFWLWVYVIFTISNTMMPNPADLRGGVIVIGILGVALLYLFVIGLGDDVMQSATDGPVGTALQMLAATFAVTITVDLLVVGVLGTIEAVIERITGDSATFDNGKLVTMRREELLRLRQEALEKERRQAEKRAERKLAQASGPPSVYRLPLPIPEPPSRTGAETPARVDREPSLPLPPETSPPAASLPARPAQPGAALPRPGPARPAQSPTPMRSPVPTPKPGAKPSPFARPSTDDEADEADAAPIGELERVPIDQPMDEPVDGTDDPGDDGDNEIEREPLPPLDSDGDAIRDVDIDDPA